MPRKFSYSIAIPHLGLDISPTWRTADAPSCPLLVLRLFACTSSEAALRAAPCISCATVLLLILVTESCSLCKTWSRIISYRPGGHSWNSLATRLRICWDIRILNGRPRKSTRGLAGLRGAFHIQVSRIQCCCMSDTNHSIQFNAVYWQDKYNDG